MVSNKSVVHGVGRTDIGKRNHNEDAFLVDESLGLLVVADGVGGHRVGDIASAITCESIYREVAAGNALHDAISRANVDVRLAVEEDQGRDRMASTVVALHFDGAGYSIAWVGDSRAYLWDGAITPANAGSFLCSDFAKQQ